jgi:hypothetical protein
MIASIVSIESVGYFMKQEKWEDLSLPRLVRGRIWPSGKQKNRQATEAFGSVQKMPHKYHSRVGD